MYCLSMISLFILRKKEPHLERPFRVYYPVMRGIALALGLLSLYSVVKYSLPFLGFHIPLIIVILGTFCLAIFYCPHVRCSSGMSALSLIGPGRVTRTGGDVPYVDPGPLLTILWALGRQGQTLLRRSFRRRLQILPCGD
ncbi:hypothetical protein [Desmospora profundinema]|uniref:Amino acid transporter n=1 Tax=Desmospora profundinema TaxID=1571184 RepID=A0ABU1IKY5_9BACL|nr:hypothetical protein [Desmospora profundinema]MDR6225433.1 amino acid transporter [Desmospora profundinema]